MTRLIPLGDRAFLASFDAEDSAAAWASAVRAQAWRGVLDVVLAYDSVGVYADPRQVDLVDLACRLERLSPVDATETAGKLIRVPVVYDSEDLPEVAQRLGLTKDEVIAAHAGREYRVYAIGFVPGYPYAGYLPPNLQGLPRRTSPRTRVPAGSVAIAGRQTAIYPSVSPGGWHLIGRTPLAIVNVERGWFPIRAGDRLLFEAIDAAEFDSHRGDLCGRDSFDTTGPSVLPLAKGEERG
jgi:KipI family sensor histidine kinase inhibitor